MYRMERHARPKTQQLAAIVGTLVIVLSLAVMVFMIIFATTLVHDGLNICILAIVAAASGLFDLALLLTLLWQHVSPRDGPLAILPEVILAFEIFPFGLTTATLAWLHVRKDLLPSLIFYSPKASMTLAAWILLGSSFIMKVTFACLSIHIRNCQEGHPSALRGRCSNLSSEKRHRLQEKIERSQEQTTNRPPGTPRMSTSQGSLKSFGALHSSLTQIVRPMSSRSRLITNTGFRLPSEDSGVGGDEPPVEDAFDSWEIDPVSRQSITASFPFPPRTNPSALLSVVNGGMLETIPDIPSNSSSASLGDGLDLPPPKYPRRSKSYSPSSHNPLSTAEATRNISSPTRNDESHIHPLFRTHYRERLSSVEGLVILKPQPQHVNSTFLAEEKEQQRPRSGGLSTQGNVPMNVDVEGEAGTEETEFIGRGNSRTVTPGEGTMERKMTPPIPDWVLGAGQRGSMILYSKRKCSEGLKAAKEEGSERDLEVRINMV